MARTIEEIKQTMTSAFMNDSAAQSAYGFGENERFSSRFSKVSIENILFYIFALCAYTIERLTDSHLQQVTAVCQQLRPHTLTWYQQQALAFRYGEAINDNTGQYDQPPTDNTLMPISHCAVTEADTNGLIVKVATADSNGNLSPLSDSMLVAFSSYINRVKDAGIRLTIISNAADTLVLSMTIYVDIAVFKLDGTLVGEPVKPIEEAVKKYLTLLPFNGELVLEHLTDYLQQIDGVEVPHINSAQYANPDTEDALTDIDVRVTPFSGYFNVNFDTDYRQSTIQYRPKQ